MPQQLLNRADVVSCLKKMGSEGMTERVATDPPGEVRPCCRFLDSFLHEVLTDVMPPHRCAPGINRQALCGKYILPFPLQCSLWIFTGQSRPHVDTGNISSPVLIVYRPHSLADLQSIAFSIVGIYILSTALSSALELAALLYGHVRAPVGVEVSIGKASAYFFSKAILGLWLLLGSRGLVNFIHSIKRDRTVTCKEENKEDGH